jgi:Cation efflux family
MRSFLANSMVQELSYDPHVMLVASPTEIEMSSSTANHDPLNFSQFKKTDAELLKLNKEKKQDLAAFYEKQNDLIDCYLNPAFQHDREEQRHLKLQIAIYGSFIANVALFALQLTAAILSKSLALFATTADAFMDLASTGVMLYAARMAAQQNYLQYPTGKTRYETAGIIVFATLMSTLSIQIVITAIETFISGESQLNFGTVSIICVSVALGTFI